MNGGNAARSKRCYMSSLQSANRMKSGPRTEGVPRKPGTPLPPASGHCHSGVFALAHKARLTGRINWRFEPRVFRNLYGFER